MSVVSAPVGMDHVLSLQTGGFEHAALALLDYQRAYNPVYGRFSRVGTYLPVEAFKLAPVTTFPPEQAEAVFTSSGTGSGRRARHHVRYREDYRKTVLAGFARVFGSGPFRLLAHLPAYAESSSLVAMAGDLIDAFGAPGSTFFLEDAEALQEAARTEGPPLVLLGAAFGLLDLLEQGAIPLPESSTVIETGGMKTHRRALPREKLHARLLEGFGLPKDRLWSEYGMCELMSQAYARSGEWFEGPPWMRVAVMDPENPLEELPDGEAGAIAVLDLANRFSACAILTQDRGVRHGDRFEVLGRLTGAELRGCNHLMERA